MREIKERSFSKNIWSNERSYHSCPTLLVITADIGTEGYNKRLVNGGARPKMVWSIGDGD